VFRALVGNPPAAPEDWQAVGWYLNELHEACSGLGQRPGFASARDLLTVESGGDVDLSQMPEDAVARCRQAWARVAGYPMTPIHGDPGASNILMTPDGPGLIDWDESRVDATSFDFAALPEFASVVAPEERWIVQQAASAWEAAVSWMREPEYARRRLSEVDDVRS
jgi:Ser/Thr protein kinase RdoA (MazF antagonist)